MSVSKYRKIPVEVIAIQYATDTLGECYPCNPNIFF